MSNWQKKLLHKKLKEIDEKIEYRKYIVSIYRDLFKKKGLPLLDLSIDYQPVYLRYPFLVKNKKEIIEEAKKRHLEIGDWFVSPVHPNLKNWSRIGYKTGSCPISEKICSHIINLPTHENITKKMALKIVDFIAQYQDILFINNLLDTISC
jgi:dTDP-4-amino-4,6-dideoxygalactose transaminase